MTASYPPATLVAVLRICADTSLPDEVALMRLIMATENAADLERQLALAVPALGRKGALRLRKLAAKARRQPAAWETVRATAATVTHADVAGRPACDAVADIAASFDRAAKLSPEASVALYSLGDPATLAAATAEIVRWMREAGLLGPEREILDVGCGIGRLEAALGGEVGRIVGIDVSSEMIGIARRRCGDVQNASFRLASGLDLSGFADESFDCVVAVDTFPYLVMAGGGLAERHVHEAARVLRPGGELAILNYSYRDTPAQDRDDLESAACAAGLGTIPAGAKPFSRWDGTAFRLAKLLV
jgi:ubiquinone/menaquinone biosynthesis C-methylase UbiE